MTPNVIVIPNFLTSTDNLFDDIINLDFDRSMKARWTASFGKSYDYSGMSYPAITFPTFLSDLIKWPIKRKTIHE